jgi:VanZ family protein
MSLKQLVALKFEALGSIVRQAPRTLCWDDTCFPFIGESMRRLFRITAWLLLVTIVVLSVVPPKDRPVTPAPHDLEHIAIFLAAGLAFGLGYSRHLVQIFGLIAFSAAIELVQLAIPGRHARVSDFVVDAVSVSMGVAVGFLLAEYTFYARFRR